MGYLGLWVTCDGVKPNNNKLEVINNMTPPTSQKVLFKFVGSVNYYRGIWSIRSHSLEPLTKLTLDKVTFKYTEVKQQLFK